MELHRVVESSPGPVRYFVRDDDVGALTDPLVGFVETFVSRQIPVSYQIIPARLTEECAQFLLAAAKAHPGLVEFGQHGLRHEMTVKGRRLKREFGPERTLDEQRSDILEGLKILRERLGPDVNVETFTPPQHKYDRSTLLAAAAAGHRIFSAACYPSRRHRLAYGLGRALGLASIRHHGISYHNRLRPEAPLFEMSIAIDVDDGKRRKLSAGGLPAAMATAAARSDAVGLMFHHALYDSASERAELAALADAMAEQDVLRFRLLGTLAPR